MTPRYLRAAPLDRVIAVFLTAIITMGLTGSVAAVALAFVLNEPWFLVGGVCGAVGWSWVAIFAFPEER